MNRLAPPRTWMGRRFVITALALVSAALVSALLFFDWRMESIVQRTARDAMTDELAELQAIAAEDGSDALLDALDVRSGLTAGHFLHLLVDAQGRPIAGNVVSWPQGMQADGAWFAFNLRDAHGVAHRALGIARAMPDGSRLMIASDMEVLSRVRADAFNAFAAALAAAVMLTLSIGFWVDRMLQRRLRGFITATEQVMAGRLDARVESVASRDELAELAQRLNAMLERVEILMSGMRAITDSLAHDLRTPLTRLDAALDAAMVAEEPERARLMREARVIADDLVHMFETMIDIARAEAGLSREAMAPTDLSALLEDMVELFGPAAEDKSISLALAPHAPCPRLAHRALVAQAIGNLLDNAIKYSRPGGVIEAAISPIDGGADIVVSDDGPGVPAEAREAAAQRFSRLPRDLGAKGSGLGLSIVSAAARLHGGRLRLEDNAPGLKAVLEIRTA